MVKEKNIEGFLVEKKIQTCGGENPRKLGEFIGYNEAITEQGEVDLSLDRAKTAKVIALRRSENEWSKMHPSEQEIYLQGADDLNANLHKILVVKKG